MSLNPQFPSPDMTPDHSAPTGAYEVEAEQAKIRAEVERHLLRLSQDLYEMEICAGDVQKGRQSAVPAYMAKINLSLKALSDLSAGMTDAVPRQVIEKVDTYSNPHSYTRIALQRATGENQYTLGRMFGLESFRRQLHDALFTDFPQIPLPDRTHVPQHESNAAQRNGSGAPVLEEESGGVIGGEEVKREIGHTNGN